MPERARKGTDAPGDAPEARLTLDPETERLARTALQKYYQQLQHWNPAGWADDSMSLKQASSRFAYLKSILPSRVFTRSLKCLISGMSAGGEMLVARREGFSEAHGAEVDPFFVDFCAQRFRDVPGIFPALYDGKNLPYPDDSFVLVVSGHVIEHTADPLQYITEHLRVLMVGGYFFLEFPTRFHYRELHTGLPSLEWLPRALRNGLLQLLGSERSPLGQDAKHRIHAILNTGLLQVSMREIRRWLSSSPHPTKIIHSCRSAPGVVRCVVKKHRERARVHVGRKG